MRISLLALLILLLPVAVSAHASGFSYEAPAGAYVLDIGYDPEKPTTADTTYLDFSLWNKDKSEAADFSDVWLRITNGSETIFASGIRHASIGQTTALIRFPEAGTYTISARFEQDGKVLAEASFPRTVSAAQSNRLIMPAAVGASGFVLGFFGAWLLIRKKKTI